MDFSAWFDVYLGGAREGIETARWLRDVCDASVVFVTAHDKFALRAFDVHAVDYLLKPFDRERFQTALNRAVEKIKTQSGPPDYADVVPFAACAADEGADGVSLINTLYGMRIDPENRRPILGTSGPVSGNRTPPRWSSTDPREGATVRGTPP